MSTIRVRTAALSCLLLSALLVQGMPLPGETIDPWFDAASDRNALLDNLQRNTHKVPIEFHDRLQYALPDGLLRVMVALTDRAPETDAFAESNSQRIHWYDPMPSYAADITPDQLHALLIDERVVFVEPDFPLVHFVADGVVDINARGTYNPSTSSSSGTGVWYFDTNAGTLQDDGVGSTVTGSSTTIAYIDSGIDRTHRDFGGWNCAVPSDPYTVCNSRIKASTAIDQVFNLPGVIGDDLPTTEAASGHGTHVAGTGSGNGYYARMQGAKSSGYGGDGYPIGVAPESGIVSVKTGDSQSAALATEALRWTYLHRNVYNINVASNSWGCDGGCNYNPTSATTGWIKTLYDNDIVVVFAAGNNGGSGSGAQYSGYAQTPWALGVAAYNDANQNLASFSSRGSSSTSNSLPTVSSWDPDTENANQARRPDVSAPGVNIFAARTLTGGTSSLMPRINPMDVGGPNAGYAGYVSMSGTSMATPHVAGAAALLFDACPGSSALDVMRALLATADSLGYQPYAEGYGKIDVRGAVDYLC